MAARTNRKSCGKYAARVGYKPGDRKRWQSGQWQGHGPNAHPPRVDWTAAVGDPTMRPAALDVAHRCFHCGKPVGESTFQRADGFGLARFHAGCIRRARKYATLSRQLSAQHAAPQVGA